MRELPILFSTPMVQAIQADTKNQTRRTAGLEKVNEKPDDWQLTGISLLCKGVFGKLDYEMDYLFPFLNKKGETVKCKPRYQKGDKIWVKETFTIIPPTALIFKANYADKPGVIKNTKWKSSLFMRKEYARTWLECTRVRCERLKDISEVDAIGEGVEKVCDYGTTGYKDYTRADEAFSDIDAKLSFTTLWEKINGQKSLESNPWVFIYDFKRIEKP